MVCCCFGSRKTANPRDAEDPPVQLALGSLESTSTRSAALEDRVTPAVEVHEQAPLRSSLEGHHKQAAFAAAVQEQTRVVAAEQPAAEEPAAAAAVEEPAAAIAAVAAAVAAVAEQPAPVAADAEKPAAAVAADAEDSIAQRSQLLQNSQHQLQPMQRSQQKGLQLLQKSQQRTKQQQRVEQALTRALAAPAAADSPLGPRSMSTDGGEGQSGVPVIKLGVQWERDSLVASCRLCDVKFGVFKRKHHCRFCGAIVCSSCCANKAAHAHPSAKGLHLACDECFGNMPRTGSGELDNKLLQTQMQQQQEELKEQQFYDKLRQRRKNAETLHSLST